MMSTQTLTYRASPLADVLHLTERRIQQLANEGIIPKAKKGDYDVIGSVKGYIHYLQARAAGRTEGSYNDPSDIKRERKRLIKAQADKVEHENHVRRGELVDLGLVTAALHEMSVLYTS